MLEPEAMLELSTQEEPWSPWSWQGLNSERMHVFPLCTQSGADGLLARMEFH